MTDSGRVSTGHPVDVGSGAVFTISHDFELPGIIPLLWRRYYSTDSTVDRWLGRGWTVPYFMTLRHESDGYRLLGENGQTLQFPSPSASLRTGDVIVNLAANMELRWKGDHYAILHWHHGSDEVEVFCFEPRGDRLMPLSRVENPAGHRVALQHDTALRPVRIVQEMEERVIDLAYNPQGLLAEIYFSSPGAQRRPLAQYTYDRGNRLVAFTDALRNVTRYAYDAAHRMTAETNPLGSSFFFSYDEQNRCIRTSGENGYLARTLEYLRMPRLTRVTDSLGNVTHYYLNVAGQVIQEVSPNGAARTTSYDEYGRVLTEADPEGGVVRYAYDDAGNRGAVTHEDGGQSRMKYTELHLLAEYQSPIGTTSKYDYDERGNVVSLTNPLGHRVTYTRDHRGLVTESRSPRGQIVRFQYGPQLRWVEVSDAISLLSRAEYDDAGNQIALYDALGLVQRVTYDPLNRPVEAFGPSSESHRFHWNALGELLEHTTSAGVWERLEYDRVGQLISHINPLGQMRFEYNTEGRLVAGINRAGERLERSYDSCHRLVTETAFDGRVEEYTHNLRGDIISVGRSDGRRVSYQYSKSGWLVARESSDGLREEFAYNESGELIRAQNNDAVVKLERNASGRVTAEVQNGRRIEYEFDEDGNSVARRLFDPVRREFSFQYDLRGRLTAIKDAAGVCQELTWDELNRLTQRRVPGGLVEALSYDRFGRLEEQRVTTPRHGSVVTRRYHYDTSNNLSIKTDSSRGTFNYTYDSASRLIRVMQAEQTTEHYRYDANGAVLESQHGQRSIHSGGRTLVAGGRNYEYGNDGCVSQIRDPQQVSVSITYNVDGQPVSIRDHQGRQIQYCYDAFGRRFAKKVNDETITYLWQGPVLAAELRDGALTDSFFFFDLEPMAQWRGSQRTIPVVDQAGAVQEVLDENGAILWRCTLETYGRLRRDEGRHASPFRLRGQYWDFETGLHYNFYRTYDPQTCDYLSPDPLGLEGGANFYSYPRNPLLWDDPFGLKCAAHKAEEGMDKYYNRKGYKRISKDKDLHATGIDAVYQAKPGHGPPEYIIAEAKSGGATLGTSKNGTVQQMSDHWIDSPAGNASNTRLESAVGTTRAADINAAAASPGGVSKQVYHPDSAGPGKSPVIMKSDYTQSGSKTW
jgi:RHS repeat-associated protein